MSEIRFNRWSHQSGTGGIYQDSSGNIGIGTSTPTSVLDIQGGSIKIGNDLLTSSGVSTFTSGLNVTSGSVGIGTDNPVNRFHATQYTANTDVATFQIGSASAYTGFVNCRVGTTGAGSFIGGLYTPDGSLEGLQGTNGLIFSTSGSNLERLRITSSGNVGIGTDTPYTNNSFNSLSIGGSGKYGLIELVKSNGVAGSWIDSYGTAGDGNLRFTTAGTSGAITFWTGGEFTEKVRITSSGNIGIGSTIPQSSLDVAGEIRASGIAITTSYPTISPSLNLNFARSRALDSRITFTRASTATYVGRDGLVKTAGDDEPRFDHDPDTLESLGLLIEEARTNRFLYSDLSTVDTTSNATTSRTTGLDGNSTSALNVTYTAAGGAYILSYSSSISASTTYTFSVWIKKVSGSTTGSVYSYVTGGTDGVLSGQIYNTDGQHLGQAPTGVWKRYSKTFTTSAGSTAIRVTMPGYDSNGLNIHYFGAQIEAGSFPTSIIPTSGSSVTRAADRARITGTNFSDFFNTTEGTLVVQGRTAAGDSSQYTNQPVISIHNGNTTNRIIMFDRDAGTLEWNVVDGSFANGSGVLLDETTSYSGAADYIMCGTYKNGAPTRAVANGLGADGNTIESSGKNDTVNIFNQMDIGNELGTRQCSAPIKQVRYYPLSLSDAQIKTLVL